LERHDRQLKRQPTLARPPELKPLVYRMFGDLAEEDTLVLTEDNHFDYLVAMTRALATEGMPAEVKGALTSSAVLFLGFRITDWDFRILLRSIRPLLAQQPQNRYTNVAVQIDPGQEATADLGGAQEYLQKYLGVSGAPVKIYWGSVDRFLAELDRRWSERPSERDRRSGTQ
jgi:hypothetical protein